MKNIKLSLLALLLISLISSCHKHEHYQTITKDVTIELYASEAYIYNLPMENTDDNYSIHTQSSLAVKSEVINNIYYYTAPATISADPTLDEVIVTNEHHQGGSHSGRGNHDNEGGGDQHYIINFHVKIVNVKSK
jgi:hypothetical protein